jgi:hypothetical protein
VAGGAQGGLGLSELRVDDDRASRPEGPRDQHERLGGSGGQQHLAGGAAVPGGDGGGRRGGVRVPREVVERVPDRGVEPRWTGRPAHVDREVDEAGRRLDVPVMPQIVVLHRNSMRDRGRRTTRRVTEHRQRRRAFGLWIRL